MASGGILRDRVIGTVGLAVTIIFGFLQFLELDIPDWITLLGIGVGVFMLGTSAGLLVSHRWSKPESMVPVKGTFLRLHIYPDNRSPSRIADSNIFRWYHLTNMVEVFSAEGAQIGKALNSILFVTFDRPVPVATLAINSPDIRLPRYEVKDFNQRFAVIVFSGRLDSGTLEVAIVDD
jgi:hypothetical protein